MFRAAVLGLACWGAYTLFFSKNATTESKNNSRILDLFQSFFRLAPKPAMPLRNLSSGINLKASAPVCTIACPILTSKEPTPSTSLTDNQKSSVGTSALISPKYSLPAFVLNPMPTDGNCLFHSISKHLNIPQEELRGMISHYLNTQQLEKLPQPILKKMGFELAEIATELAFKINQIGPNIALIEGLGEKIDLTQTFSEVKEYQPFIQYLNFQKQNRETNSCYLERLTKELNDYAIKRTQVDKKQLDLFKNLVSLDKFHAGQAAIEIMATLFDAQIFVYNWDEKAQNYRTHEGACSTFIGCGQIHLHREGNHYNLLTLSS